MNRPDSLETSDIESTSMYWTWVDNACHADNPNRGAWCEGFTVGDMLIMNERAKGDERFAH